MAKYRYWMLDDEEDLENDPTIEASDPQDAAETACEDLINDGDSEVGRNNKIELAVRLVSGGPAHMFETFIDWSPSCTAYPRGVMPEETDDGKDAEALAD